MIRRTHVQARRVRYRRSGCRPVRVVARTRRHRLVYRGRAWALVVMLVLIVAALAIGTLAGHIGVGAVVAGLVLAAWLGYGMRVTRPVPAGPHGDGPRRPAGRPCGSRAVRSRCLRPVQRPGSGTGTSRPGRR
jgi:hypothetical protein